MLKKVYYINNIKVHENTFRAYLIKETKRYKANNECARIIEPDEFLNMFKNMGQGEKSLAMNGIKFKAILI